jgi:hypothetical protein
MGPHRARSGRSKKLAAGDRDGGAWHDGLPTSFTRPTTIGNFFLMFWNAKDTATPLRMAFHFSSAGAVSRLGLPWGSHICKGVGGPTGPALVLKHTLQEAGAPRRGSRCCRGGLCAGSRACRLARPMPQRRLPAGESTLLIGA